MRTAIVCLAALALTACAGSSRIRQDETTVPTLDVRRPSHVRLYTHGIPRCPFREVATVSGRDYRQLQDRAFQLRANAVILDTGARHRGSPYTGSAVQFTRADCQQ